MFKYALPCVLLLAACQPKQERDITPPPVPPQTEQVKEMTGSDIRDKDLGSAIPLAATSGGEVLFGQAVNHISLITFGYTHCPDICPTTLLTLSQAMKKLSPKQAASVRVYFVTLDPERDTIEALHGYVTLFHPDFIALRPTMEQLEQVKQDGRVVGEFVPLSNGSYTVDHSTGVYLIDKQGKTAIYEPYGTTAQELADDIALFLEQNP